MSGFDTSSPSTLHLGSITRAGAVAIGIALTSFFAPAQAAMPPLSSPMVSVVFQTESAEATASQTPSEIQEQIAAERADQASVASVERASRGGLTEQASEIRNKRILAETVRLENVKNAFIKIVHETAIKIGSGSCFGGFLASLPTSVDLSTVMIVALDAEGHTMATGSGFIVADSATAGDPYNRIITARHVVNPDDIDPYGEVIDALQKVILRSTDPAGSLLRIIQVISPTFEESSLPQVNDDLVAEAGPHDAAREVR